MTGAKPLRSGKRVEAPGKKPKPKARFTRADEQRVLKESLEADIDDVEHGSGDALRFKRSSVSRTTMRMLSRGSYAIQAEIDLHGMTIAEAKPRLASFVERCAKNGKLCIRIVVHAAVISSVVFIHFCFLVHCVVRSILLSLTGCQSDYSYCNH